ncbi:MAG TPA: hypothetical protein VJ817_12650 [Gemmatimonadales bacterium]|nr:hypothetical protein [Gemmatimonadales bacterium]
MGSSRRRFLLGIAALVPLPFLARRLHGAAVAGLDSARLRALAGAVLPSELGAAGLERTVVAFERWLAGYREGVELLHGYGTGEIRLTGPSPALRWAAQLDALGSSFVTLSVPERQARLRSALEAGRFGGLPPVDRAPHLAIGLLAFFYRSPEATDLCYQASIGRESCRALDTSPRPPRPSNEGG